MIIVFLVSWFQRFFISWFLALLVSTIYHIFISCFLEYNGTISKVFEILLGDSSGFSAPVFSKLVKMWDSQHFEICKDSILLKDLGFSCIFQSIPAINKRSMGAALVGALEVPECPTNIGICPQVLIYNLELIINEKTKKNINAKHNNSLKLFAL